MQSKLKRAYIHKVKSNLYKSSSISEEAGDSKCYFQGSAATLTPVFFVEKCHNYTYIYLHIYIIFSHILHTLTA